MQKAYYEQIEPVLKWNWKKHVAHFIVRSAPETNRFKPQKD